jgi:predicted nucleic acid-binding protein
MNLIVDANILFAALLKEGKTIEILLNPFFNFHAPEFLFEEFEKYEEEILGKMHRTEDEFSEVLENLKEIVNVVPKEDYTEKFDLGKEISPDDNDFYYFALALKLNCAIWSNDKKLKEQNRVKVYSTEELVGSLK